MLLKKLKDLIWEEDPISVPFRTPGRKPPIRISDEEEQRLIALMDCLREWGEMKRREASQPPQKIHIGEPNYSRRWKREKDDLNGYMRTLMYDGGTPGIMLYRCGGSGPRGLKTQSCLNAVVNRALVDDAVKLLMSSLAADAQTTYLKGWKTWARFCKARGVSPWVNAAVRNWDQNILSFLTWEHAVMKNGGDTLAKLFSAIRFLHLIEGRGGGLRWQIFQDSSLDKRSRKREE